MEYFDEEIMPITTGAYLYLLGTPFRAINSGEFDEFDLNIFFSAKGEGDSAEFVYKDEVQKWLDLIRGGYADTVVSDLELRTEKPPMPFSHAPLLKVLTHTFWFLPSVASCHAMRNLLEERQNSFYADYRVIVAAGSSAGIGVEADCRL